MKAKAKKFEVELKGHKDTKKEERTESKASAKKEAMLLNMKKKGK